METPKRGRSDRYKNQLIPKPLEDEGPAYVNWIVALGVVLLVAAFGWGVGVWRTVGPAPLALAKALVRGRPDVEEWDALLQHHSHFGHAILGPLELATLGTIILSFVHVIHQLRSQHHTEQTRFQPVVTCMALLSYDVEGTDTPERLRIANPLLKLRLRNLGDSPATFIGIDVSRLCLVRANGGRDEAASIKSVQVDSLGKHDGLGMGEQEVELSLPESMREGVARLIADICHAEGPEDERLEVGVTIGHENVMGLAYTAEGRFYWSRQLCDPELSERQQFERITGMRKTWAPAGAQVAEMKREMTIGRYIGRGQTLQAALAQKSVARKAG